MPYRSDAQRKFMHANYPKLARKWDSEYGGIGKLPEHAHTALLKKYGKNKEAAAKQEKHPSWANRIIAGGALLGAGHGYMRPHSAFSGGMENGGNTIKGRLAGMAVGSTVGAGLGWLPKILMDAKKEQQGVKTASQDRTAYLHKLAVSLEQLRTATTEAVLPKLTRAGMAGKRPPTVGEMFLQAFGGEKPRLSRAGHDAFAVNPTTAAAETVAHGGERPDFPPGIYVKGSVGQKVAPKVLGAPVKMTGENHEALNRSILLHENAEYGRHPGTMGTVAPGQHLSWKPPLQDLNISSTLPPNLAGAAGVIKAMRKKEIDALVRRHPSFGALNLGDTRVSRHAIRRIQQAEDTGYVSMRAKNMVENAAPSDYAITRGEFARELHDTARPGVGFNRLTDHIGTGLGEFDRLVGKENQAAKVKTAYLHKLAQVVLPQYYA